MDAKKDVVEDRDASSLWTDLLNENARQQDGVDFKERNIIVLGDGDSGKARFATVLTGKSLDKSDPQLEKGVGLDFRYYNVLDDAKDAVGRLGVWRLQGDAHVHGALLKEVQAEAAVLVADLSRPWAVEASLNRWTAVLKDNGKGNLPLVVVGTKVDLSPEPHEPLIALMRRWSISHEQAGLVWLSMARKVDEQHSARVRRLVEEVAGVLEPPKERFVQADEAEGLVVPPGWDSEEKLATLGSELGSIAAAPEVGTTKAEKEEEIEEAEDDQAWLLRHQKLLETLKEEQQALTPSKPVAEVLDAPATPADKGAAAGGGSAFTTPIKTPIKTPSRPSTSAAAAAAMGDNEQLAMFFNSLLTKDKSPAPKGTPK